MAHHKRGKPKNARADPNPAEARVKTNGTRVDTCAAESAVGRAIEEMAVTRGTVAKRLGHVYDRHLAPLRLYKLPSEIRALVDEIHRDMSSRKLHEMQIKDGMSPAQATARAMSWQTADKVAKELVRLHALLHAACERFDA